MLCSLSHLLLVGNAASSQHFDLKVESASSAVAQSRWKEQALSQPAGIYSQRHTQTLEFKKKISRTSWWIFPTVALIFSYCTFPTVSEHFHHLVQWVSHDSWLPDSPEKMSLLSNVVTQVVNGPVVTSISVLFATLISVTISTLHSRQQDVQMSLINEIEALRQIQYLLSSPIHSTGLKDVERAAFLDGVELLKADLTKESEEEEGRPENFSPHDYVSLHSGAIILLCDQMDFDLHTRHLKQTKELVPLLSNIRRLVETVREERKIRWTAIMSMHFPLAHYMTLGLLMASILVAFLVTTDEADFIFLQGLQVRVLWSVLVTCFSSLVVLCSDLSDAYSGAYTVSTDFSRAGLYPPS